MEILNIISKAMCLAPLVLVAIVFLISVGRTGAAPRNLHAEAIENVAIDVAMCSAGALLTVGVVLHVVKRRLQKAAIRAEQRLHSPTTPPAAVTTGTAGTGGTTGTTGATGTTVVGLQRPASETWKWWEGARGASEISSSVV